MTAVMFLIQESKKYIMLILLSHSVSIPIESRRLLRLLERYPIPICIDYIQMLDSYEGVSS